MDAGRCQRVQAVLELKGELRLNADGSEVKRLPLLVEGRLTYEEKILEAGTEPWTRRSVRYYDEARATIEVGQGRLEHRLQTQHPVFVARVQAGSSAIFSPHGPLSREELDLIDVQGNTLAWDCLLPGKPVRIGDHWPVDSERLAVLLGWEVVTQNDGDCSLTSVQDGVALIEVSGRLSGAVGGVGSELEWRAKCNFDLRQRTITWFAAAIRETRAIGHAEPGFEVSARLRVAAAPLEAPARLTDSQLAGIALDVTAGANLLQFESVSGSYRFIHDRRWRSMLDRPDLCVFRCVDRGDLLAQCNVSPLPDLEPGQHLSLEEFQTEVLRSLNERSGQIVEATQASAEGGTRVLRIVAAGNVAEIPIQWVYYHLSNDQGRRVSLAFTLESKLVERFAEADRTLVDTFEFLPRPEPQEAQRPEPQTPRR